MGVSQSPPDPWPPLQEAVDAVVYLSSGRDGSFWGPIAELARTVFVALKALKIETRELFSRTAKLNDRVDKLEKNTDQAVRQMSFLTQAMIDLVRLAARDELPQHPFGVEKDADLSHLDHAIRIGDTLRNGRELGPVWLDTVAQCAAAAIPALVNGREDRAMHCLAEDVPVLIAEIMRLHELVPFITDGRFNAREALAMFDDQQVNDPDWKAARWPEN